jgi:hypothetical protein
MSKEKSPEFFGTNNFAGVRIFSGIGLKKEKLTDTGF